MPVSGLVCRVIAFQESHKESVVRDYRHYVKAMEHALDWSAQIITDLNYLKKRSWPPHRNFQYVYFPQIIKLLWRSHEDWLQGWYDESCILNRSALDGLIRIVFLSCYPNDVGAVLVYSRGKGKRSFNMTNFMRDDLGLDWEFIWGVDSSYTHGKTAEAIRSLVAAAEKANPKPVELQWKYDKEAITRPMNICLFEMWFLWRLLLKLFPQVLDGAKPQARNAINTVEEGLRQMIEGMPNRLCGCIADVVRVEGVIGVAEAGGDWLAAARLDASTDQMR